MDSFTRIRNAHAIDECGGAAALERLQFHVSVHTSPPGVRFGSSLEVLARMRTSARAKSCAPCHPRGRVTRSRAPFHVSCALVSLRAICLLRRAVAAAPRHECTPLEWLCSAAPRSGSSFVSCRVRSANQSVY